MSPELIAAYSAARRRLAAKGYNNSPAHCLAIVRADLARAGRYVTGVDPAGAASYQNAPNKRGGRWIERPDLAGLRFVGFADKLARLDHTGWFQHPGGDPGDVYRAAVYQLPARNGRPIYVEGYVSGEETRSGFKETSTGGTEPASFPAVVFLAERHLGDLGGTDTYVGDSCSALRDAARGADREAEISAEREREYQDSYALGREAADAVEEAGQLRETVRRNLAELRGLRGLANAPSLCATLRGCIRSDLAAARKLYAKAAELWAKHGEPVSWRPDLADAFAEAAGAASYWESRK